MSRLRIVFCSLLLLLMVGSPGCSGLNAAIERASVDNPGVIFIFHADFALEVKSVGVSAAGKGDVKDPGAGAAGEGEGGVRRLAPPGELDSSG